MGQVMGRKKNNVVHVSVSLKSTVHEYACYVLMWMCVFRYSVHCPSGPGCLGRDNVYLPHTVLHRLRLVRKKECFPMDDNTAFRLHTMCSEMDAEESSLHNRVVSHLNDMDIELLTVINRQKPDHWLNELNVSEAGFNLIQAMVDVTSTYSISSWIPGEWMEAGVRELNIILHCICT